MLALSTSYSLMHGVRSPADLCRAARRAGYTRLALTDRDNLYGLWPFLAACREEEISPIIGAAVTEPGAAGSQGPARLALCLVENETGYRNLCRLLTRRHTDPSFQLMEAVAEQAAGLIVLATAADCLAAWAGRGISVAAALTGRPSGANHRLWQQARRLRVPAVVVPTALFLEPADREVHRLLRAVATRSSLARPQPGELATAGTGLDSPAHYRQRFAVWPDAVAQTRLLAERCAFTGPDFGIVLPPYAAPDGRSPEALLRQEAYAGAGRRYGAPLPERVRSRLEHELAIIHSKGFSSYFLVVQDIVRRHPRICGRGSGAASLVAYCLEITNVCPVKHDLYFERFLNPGRQDPPDIDVDFAWDERDAVLAEVLREHGCRAAMVSSHILFQPRMALRETGRAFGLTDQEIGRVTKRLPWLRRLFDDAEEGADRLRDLPQLREVDLAEPWPQIIGLAQRLIGIPRHLSVHPGGVVITPDPIADSVPVERAAKGVPIIQWDKDGAEEAGLVKIDLLGNRSLGVIRDAIGNLRANGGTLDETRWEPEDDPQTRQTVAAGRTMGCFYIESPAIRLLQQKAGRGDFEHLVIHSSIIRPAANEYIREYLRRLHGGAWAPLHPLLGEVLAETYGIMVYQEDVSRAAVALAGFSHAEADGLRKVLSKKDRARRLRDYREQFFSGTRQRGLDSGQAAALWEMMMSFDGYSFCKPHSASYARVSFQAAFLKTHFPAEFMAAVISNQGGYYSTFAYVSEARRLGLTVLPPDVRCSAIRWQGRGREIRVGLMAVRDLTAATRDRIVAERQHRPFADPTDFFRRVRPDQEEARSLIHAGGLDTLAPGRDHAELLWELARWQQRREAPPNLFGSASQAAPPRLPPTPPLERCRREFRALGFLCHHHPLAFYARRLIRHRTIKAKELSNYIKKKVWFAGWLITGKTVRTKHGEPMEFLTFEDETGLVETTFFPAIYHRCCHLLETHRPFLLHGLVEEDFGAVTLTVERAERLS